MSGVKAGSVDKAVLYITGRHDMDFFFLSANIWLTIIYHFFIFKISSSSVFFYVRLRIEKAKMSCERVD